MLIGIPNVKWQPQLTHPPPVMCLEAPGTKGCSLPVQHPRHLFPCHNKTDEGLLCDVQMSPYLEFETSDGESAKTEVAEDAGESASWPLPIQLDGSSSPIKVCHFVACSPANKPFNEWEAWQRRTTACLLRPGEMLKHVRRRHCCLQKAINSRCAASLLSAHASLIHHGVPCAAPLWRSSHMTTCRCTPDQMVYTRPADIACVAGRRRAGHGEGQQDGLRQDHRHR